MTIVDTSVWVDYFAKRLNTETIWLLNAMDKVEIGVSDVVLCEILQGIRNDASLARVRRDLSGFRLIESGGEAIAVASARNYRSLRAEGYTVRTTVDCMIATLCLQKGYLLLHRGRDLMRSSGI